MSDTTVDTDVLIVGAGPTGLTLACELARRGVRHRILERAAAPGRASRGKSLQPRGLEVLDDLGVATALCTLGAVRLPVRMYDTDGRAVDRPSASTPASTPTPFPEPLWIAEFDVERALRDRLGVDGGRVEFGHTVLGFEQDVDRVRVQVETPDGRGELTARWVIGADGGHSTVRKATAVPFPGEPVNFGFYLGDVRTTDLDRGRQHLWASQAGMLILTPLPSTDLWQFQCAAPASATEAEPSLELYQRMLDERAGAGRVRLTDASWLSRYRANVRLAERYRIGRVLLAGDAAHTHSPAGGQGMNLGIQDGYNLGWKLAAVLDGADEIVLDSYEAERRPVAAAVLADSTNRAERVRAGARGNAGALDTSVRGVTDEFTTGLTIGYPTSPLTRDCAGGRAPYVVGLRGPGFAGSTFDLLLGPHWTVLAFTDRPMHLPVGEDVRLYRIGAGAIEDSAARTAFGVRPDTLVLVRPDGYLAMTAPVDDGAAVIDHLARFRRVPISLR